MMVVPAVLVVLVAGVTATSPAPDLAVLSALYHATDGSQWENSRGWLGDDSPCDLPWYGLECNGSAVTKIVLDSNSLRGTIPSELASLTQLSHLSLHYNDALIGTIPTLANLTQLSHLGLVHNS